MKIYILYERDCCHDQFYKAYSTYEKAEEAMERMIHKRLSGITTNGYKSSYKEEEKYWFIDEVEID